MQVAEYIANFLVEQGITTVFGFPGGATLKIADAMVDTGRIRYVQNYHEQGVGFAVDGIARMRGDVGVGLVTSGPGAINVLAGVANAYYDSIPCVFFTGQESTYNINKAEGVRQNGFQDTEIVEIAKTLTKYCKTLVNPNDIRFELEKSFFLARDGRQGPVLLDIPLDVQFASINPEEMKGFTPPKMKPQEFQVESVLRLLFESRRPVLLVGGGIRTSGSFKLLKQVARRIGAPVVATLNGLDAYEGVVSFSGMHGNTHSNLAIYNSDLLIVLGARLSLHQTGKLKNKYISHNRIIHVDTDQSELGRSLKPEISILADLKDFLSEFDRRLEQVELPDYSPWRKQVDEWTVAYSKNCHVNPGPLDPVSFVELLNAEANDDAVFVADVGQHQMWVAQGFSMRGSQRLFNSSGHGSMGYALPAAIGAWYAEPDRQVFVLAGDGGFQMNMQELQLVSHFQIPCKIVVFNNKTLGKIREIQKKFYSSRYIGTCEEEYSCVNIEGIASAYSIPYYRLSRLEDFNDVTNMLKNDGPCIVEVCLDINSKLLNRYDDEAVYAANIIKK